VSSGYSLSYVHVAATTVVQMYLSLWRPLVDRSLPGAPAGAGVKVPVPIPWLPEVPHCPAALLLCSLHGSLKPEAEELLHVVLGRELRSAQRWPEHATVVPNPHVIPETGRGIKVRTYTELARTHL